MTFPVGKVGSRWAGAAGFSHVCCWRNEGLMGISGKNQTFLGVSGRNKALLHVSGRNEGLQLEK